MVLFLFVVMMLNLNMAKMREGFIRLLPLGILIALVVIAEMVIVITKGFGFGKTAVSSEATTTALSNTRELGKVLYTDYLIHFELAAAILLLAIVAAIVLTLHHISGTKHQNPGKQVKVRRNDRLRIVKMDAEKTDKA
jgi:NADH-quinone oxidoreductase subunit J